MRKRKKRAASPTNGPARPGASWTNLRAGLCDGHGPGRATLQMIDGGRPRKPGMPGHRGGLLDQRGSGLPGDRAGGGGSPQARGVGDG